MTESDPRFSKVKDAIDRAVFSLMKEKDFETISVSDIAKRAQINRSTFYHHYLDKYDWLEQCLNSRLQEVADVCRDVHYEDGTDNQLDKFRRIFQHFDENYSFYSLMLKNEGTLFSRNGSRKSQEKCFMNGC